MPRRPERLWPVAGCAAIAALGLLIGFVTTGGSASSALQAAETTTSASELAPIHGKYAPVIRPGDFVTMVDTLGGDASELRAFDDSDVTRDEADYPQ